MNVLFCRAMFAKAFGSILFSALVVTSSAGFIDIVDGNDRPVVTKQVVRIAKACPAGAARDYCTVDVQAYSGYSSTTCHGPNEGFVKLSGKTVWSAGWCSSLDNSRGITIVDVDTHSCTAKNVQTFDTHESESNAAALVTYLRQLPPGAVIVGVTGDEARSNLGSALETLKSMRVDVADIRERGNFAFVLQKDYSFEPIVAKGLDFNVPPATINVRLEEECRILLQQNIGGTTFFNRSWAEFINEFGEETSNYWMGLSRMHSLTIDGNYKLRVDLQAKANGEWYWAEYLTFRVLDMRTNYIVWVDGHRGTAGNALNDQNGMRFSARDHDVDDHCSINCASDVNFGNSGGFWYGACGYAFVNSPVESYRGFTWYYLPIGGPYPDIHKLLISRFYLVSKV